MAPSYKLVYFNARARAELIRLVFSAAGVDFTDERIEFADWPAKKPKSPSGQLPYLEFDGKAFPESLCLSRFLARKYNIMGKDEIEQLKCDIVIAQCEDIRNAWVRYTFDTVLSDGQKAELKKKFFDETLPTFLAKFEKQFNDTGSDFLVGSSLTVADLALFDILETPQKDKAGVLDKFPKVAAFFKRIEAVPKIAKYLSTRPNTPA